ncbi:hypothetical protein CDL15_Pgr013076 [Punica granatum]|nr:hypothetical protein CDL15_Pgr013076 [Punica granatum]
MTASQKKLRGGGSGHEQPKERMEGCNDSSGSLDKLEEVKTVAEQPITVSEGRRKAAMSDLQPSRGEKGSEVCVLTCVHVAGAEKEEEKEKKEMRMMARRRECLLVEGARR